MGQADSDNYLAPYRVLDLTDARGILCGKMLGDLGAAVVHIEPPGGSPTRNAAPFLDNTPDPEKSLWWFAYNSNKRGVTLNLQDGEGRGLFLRLVKKSDFVIENFPPGYLDSLGIGYPDLAMVNPRVILISITPFGQEGPYSKYKGSDLVTSAMGGVVYATGDPDRPPLRVSFPQSYLMASADAAAGAMLALGARHVSGEGQHVDVSIQESILDMIPSVTETYDLMGEVMVRAGSARLRGKRRAAFRVIWPCKDGYVCYTRVAGPSGVPSMQHLSEWMEEEGYDVAPLKGLDWATVDFDVMAQEHMDAIFATFERFFKGYTIEELYAGAREREIILDPVYDIAHLLASPQLNFRKFFQDVEHPELGRSIRYPVEYIKVAPHPIQVSRVAPHIGEHNMEIYNGDLGLTVQEIERLIRKGGI